MKVNRVITVLVLILIAHAAAVFAEEAEWKESIDAAFRAFKQENYEQAASLYTDVLKTKSLTARERAVAYLLRGEAYLENHEYARALQDFDRALRIRRNYTQAVYFKARAQEKLGNYAEAKDEIEKALAADPKNPKYQHLLDMINGKIKAKAEGTWEEPPPPAAEAKENN